jgi:hypothetical protein
MSPSNWASPSFAADIRPLFRELDRDEMAVYFDLWELDDVKRNAELIVARLVEGDMPCDRPWPEDRVLLFKSWIEAGFPA